MVRPRTRAFVRFATIGSALAFLLTLSRDSHADLSRKAVVGTEIDTVELAGKGVEKESASLRALGTEPWHEGTFSVSFRTAEHAVEIPWCAGRKSIFVDEVPKNAAPGPAVLELTPGEHTVRFQVEAGAYEHRIACGGPIVAGVVTATRVGLQSLRFDSPVANAGGGVATVFVPSRVSERPSDRVPLLVGVHPWNGSPVTYAAYRALLEQAEAQGVILLFPSGLGNSLYTAAAEGEVMRAIDVALGALPIDPSRVSIWGASMGGAGATTIGFHHPDRFASVTSFFGDASYHLNTYVKSILKDEAGAHAVNPVDVVENARLVPVWLIHGIADKVSPVRESDELNAALTKLGYPIRYDRVPGRGHEGSLVELYIRQVVALATTSTISAHPSRVVYKSVRGVDRGAYGVTIDKRAAGDAIVDISFRENAIHVMRATNVARVTLSKGALGATPGVPIVQEDTHGTHPTVNFTP